MENKRYLKNAARFIAAVMIAVLCSFVSKGQTRDSVGQVQHDSSYVQIDTVITITNLSKVVTHDSTFKVPVLVTPTDELFGFYVAYDAFVLGDLVSEGGFLMKMQREGVNMLNWYARAKLYSSSDRDKVAKFVAKAKTNFGIKLVTIDVRLTNSQEYPGWVAYYAKYGNTISMIEPLTEFEPYRLNDKGVYPYADMFVLLQKMDALTKQYGVVLNWYEGWIGKGYSNPQAAVDSMVLHCGRIFVSNYVSMSRYLNDVWDSSMQKRLDQGGSDYGGITKACAKLRKPIIVIEIGDLEPEFTKDFYSCPVSSTKKCKPYFGTTWDATKARYNTVSSPLVKQWITLGGKTIFYTSLIPALNRP